jgi:hypothetical protein
MSLPDGNDLFSACLPGRGITYRFGVKRSANGGRYLAISQAPAEGGSPAGPVLVAEAELEAFCRALRSVAAFLHSGRVEQEADGAAGQPSRTYEVAQIRKRHARAYEPWSAAEDERLRQRHGQGADVAALAAEFQRKPSAVRSRLMRLGLT